MYIEGFILAECEDTEGTNVYDIEVQVRVTIAKCIQLL